MEIDREPIETEEYFSILHRIPKHGKTKVWGTEFCGDKFKEAYLSQCNVSQGGWYDGRKWLTDKRIDEIEKRWVAKSYATRADKLLEDEISDELRAALKEIDRQYGLEGGISQCGGCMFFAATGGDFGLCWNEKSMHDGQIVFEHGGCIENSVIQELLGEIGVKASKTSET